jgi:DNA-directed RNA polymerase specialized sigma24 family protein
MAKPKEHSKKTIKRHVPFSKERLKVISDQVQLPSMLKNVFEGDQKSFDQFIEQDLKNAYDLVQRELAYHNALNELAPNEIDPYDIIDEAILELLESKPGSKLVPTKRLTARLLQLVHKAVSQLEERERREISVEGNVQDPAEEAGFRTLSEHVLDFWQPDQDQTMADIIPDEQVPTPAEIEDMKARQNDIYKALAAMPQDMRENFVLFAVEHWSVEDIAEWRSIAPEKVKEELRSAQKLLMERLREKGELENRPPHQLPHVHDRG